VAISSAQATLLAVEIRLTTRSQNTGPTSDSQHKRKSRDMRRNVLQILQETNPKEDSPRRYLAEEKLLY
jgi:hypothetical protein